MFSRRLIALGMFTPALVVATLAAAEAARAGNNIQTVEVYGTAFRVMLTDGSVLEGQDLAGATISVAFLGETQPRRIRLGAITTDPMDSQGEVLL